MTRIRRSPVPKPAAAAPRSAPSVHRIDAPLLKRAVRVLVVGCGGNGSEIVSGLPYLHQALLAWGHPAGLEVLLIDGDVVSPTNVVRQIFAPADVGHFKSLILVNRLNAFWSMKWRAIPKHLEAIPPLVEAYGERRRRQGLGADIVIGCVDSRAARRIIHDRIAADGRVNYWLDLGNDASSGQFVLGCPPMRAYDRAKTMQRLRPSFKRADGPPSAERLPTVAELYPEVIDGSRDGADTLPSCSAQEALQRQEPFVNRTIAGHALALLARLFRYGEISHHGGFVNLATGRMVPIPVSPEHWARTMASNAVKPMAESGRAKRRSA